MHPAIMRRLPRRQPRHRAGDLEGTPGPVGTAHSPGGNVLLFLPQRERQLAKRAAGSASRRPDTLPAPALPFISLSSGFCCGGRGPKYSQDLTAPHRIRDRIPTCSPAASRPRPARPHPRSPSPGAPLPVPGSPGHGSAGAGLRREPRGPQGAAASRCPPPACVPPRLRSGVPHGRGEVSQEKEEEEVAEEEEKEEEETG